MESIKAVVWDLGGVLLDDPSIKGFWEESHEATQLRGKFGRGTISIEEFIKEGSKLKKLTEEEFKKSYNTSYLRVTLSEQVFEIYRRVVAPTYIYTDTNPLHIQSVKEDHTKLFDISEKEFISSDIGMRKRDEGAFTFLIKELGILPQEILFIDNKQDICDHAIRHGIKTICFEKETDAPDDLREALISHGVLK